jgi:predicted amidohydrolase
VSSFDGFATDVTRLVDEASNAGADLVVFPEYCTAGLIGAAGSPLDSVDQVRAAFATAASALHQPYLELFGGLAAKAGAYILGGTQFYENDNDGRCYNAAFFFSPEGGVTEQRKTHVTYELIYNRSLASAGDDVTVVDTDFGKVGINVCYDIAFPEIARYQTDLGMEILLNPVCVLNEFGVNRFRTYGASRATENQCFVVNSQVTGALPDLPDPPITFQARSSVHAPIDVLMGDATGVVADAGGDGEQVLMADVDLAQLRAYRKEGVPAMLHDRRPDLYRALHASNEMGAS